jgi:hypothetical protein
VEADVVNAELCPTCGIWWRGVEHSCRLPTYSTSTVGLPVADTDPRDVEIATLRAALDGLAKAAALPRNCGGGVTLKGEWIAVPKADFDALRAALAAAKEATDAG